MTPDSPKHTAMALIDELENDDYLWYEASMYRNYKLWLACELFALFAGFGTSLIAALGHGLLNSDGPFFKWLLVLLPFSGAVASTVLVQSKVFSRFRLREKGRIDVMSLYTEGKGKFAAAKSPDDYIELHKSLRDRREIIEREQADGFFKNIPSFTKP